jgi:hypothetical protein
MYADKAGQFFDSILHASNVGKPLMGRYLEATWTFSEIASRRKVAAEDRCKPARAAHHRGAETS